MYIWLFLDIYIYKSNWIWTWHYQTTIDFRIRSWNKFNQKNDDKHKGNLLTEKNRKNDIIIIIHKANNILHDIWDDDKGVYSLKENDADDHENIATSQGEKI